MNYLVLVLDRLSTRLLAPYGGTSVEQPAFCHLAATSTLFEQHFAEDTTFLGTSQQLLGDVDASSSLPQIAQQRGYNTVLVSDDPELLTTSAAGCFDKLHAVPLPVRENEDASEQIAPHETHLGDCFSQLIGTLADCSAGDAPFFLWGHFSALANLWESPLELRGLNLDEEDPPAYAGVLTPEAVELPQPVTPDALLPFVSAYEGEMLLLDDCLAVLLDFLEELPEDLTLVLTSTRGYPLGDHGFLGGESLYSEATHLPLFVRRSGTPSASLRVQEFTTPNCLQTMLGSWLNKAKLESHTVFQGAVNAWSCEQIVTTNSLDQRAIRTKEWLLLDKEEPELYAKPDDFYDINNVASLCHQVVEELSSPAEESHE